LVKAFRNLKRMNPGDLVRDAHREPWSATNRCSVEELRRS
jgi:hypothetical protein